RPTTSETAFQSDWASARGGKEPVIGRRTSAEVMSEISRERSSMTDLLKGRRSARTIEYVTQCNAGRDGYQTLPLRSAVGLRRNPYVWWSGTHRTPNKG